jgi:hypothetical protein
MKSLTRIAALTLGITAFSSMAGAQALDNYKLVVIQQSPGTSSILDGQYAKGLEQVTLADSQSAAQGFENAMALCAAQIKLNALADASKACNWAVTLIDVATEYQRDVDKYKALALNNRAIAKYLSNDHSGAYQDFSQAMTLHQSELIEGNYQHFSAQLVKQQFSMVAY